jgi:hypothetical protein
LILFNNFDHQHQAAWLNAVVGGVVQDVTMQHPLSRFGHDDPECHSMYVHGMSDLSDTLRTSSHELG